MLSPFASLSALLPRRCPGCSSLLGRAVGVCDACVARFEVELSAQSMLNRGHAQHLISLGRYDGPLRRAVQALKYEGCRDVAPALARVLAPAVPSAWQVQAVCSVPLHRKRLQQRGYNQAELLAGAVAARLNLPCEPLLTRVRATRQQARLPRGERHANVRGAFRATCRSPDCVLLVDDVLTTGSTLAACAEALREGGARSVYFLVAAR